ncbi:MAG: hypothetical protein KC441_04820 [Anaerolineales bacterium]|nr:hypothetical protein [Anaerolineales bacterium]
MTPIMWWVTVAAYWATAVLCGLAAYHRQATPRSRRLWAMLAVVMALLGINKQGNLVGRLTTEGRLLAWTGAWYQNRAGLQIALAAIVVLLAGGLLLWLLRRLRPLSGPEMTAVVGVVYLLGFALVRAISLHAIDAFLYRPVLGVYPNWLLELGGIALVAVPALLAWRRPLPAPSEPLSG